MRAPKHTRAPLPRGVLLNTDTCSLLFFNSSFGDSRAWEHWGIRRWAWELGTDSRVDWSGQCLGFECNRSDGHLGRDFLSAPETQQSQLGETRLCPARSGALPPHPPFSPGACAQPCRGRPCSLGQEPRPVLGSFDVELGQSSFLCSFGDGKLLYLVSQDWTGKPSPDPPLQGKWGWGEHVPLGTSQKAWHREGLKIYSVGIWRGHQGRGVDNRRPSCCPPGKTGKKIVEDLCRHATRVRSPAFAPLEMMGARWFRARWNRQWWRVGGGPAFAEAPWLAEGERRSAGWDWEGLWEEGTRGWPVCEEEAFSVGLASPSTRFTAWLPTRRPAGRLAHGRCRCVLRAARNKEFRLQARGLQPPSAARKGSPEAVRSTDVSVGSRSPPRSGAGSS